MSPIGKGEFSCTLVQLVWNHEGILPLVKTRVFRHLLQQISSVCSANVAFPEGNPLLFQWETRQSSPSLTVILIASCQVNVMQPWELPG